MLKHFRQKLNNNERLEMDRDLPSQIYIPVVNNPKGWILQEEQEMAAPAKPMRDSINWKKLTMSSIAGLMTVALLGGIAIGWFIKPCHVAPAPSPTTTTETPSTTTVTDPPFPPPTKHPLPPHPETIPPISLLYQMGMDPNFTEVHCAHADPSVYKYDVVVGGHTFTSPGGDEKKQAKTTAAMVANEALFKFRYPSMPQPKSKCEVIADV